MTPHGLPIRLRVNSLFLACFCLLSTAFAEGGVGLPGVPNFHKVNDGVYRGGQPTPEGFKSLAGLGIKTIVDLRNIGEHSQDDEEKAVKAHAMRYVSVPMKGLSAPTNEQVSAVLALLKDSGTGPVFVHCRRGSDRTGTVIACYRITYDCWENKKALTEARSYGMSRLEIAMQRFVVRYEPVRSPSEASCTQAGFIQP